MCISLINMDKFRIQNIIFKQAINNSNKLFFHVFYIENKKYIYTDTYINVFHYERWKNLTGCENYYLKVACSGTGELSLYGFSLNDHNKCTKIESYKICKTRNIENYIFNIDGGYEFYFFTYNHLINDYIYIDKAYYGIKNVYKYNKISMAIISTTYKRIDSIKKLINKYVNACIENSDFKKNTHFYVINNNYSDKDDLLKYKSDNITIINNKENFGGAGGFSQGAKLAVKSRKFTHVLFMDDDALTYEESWFRSMALLRYLRSELQDLPISATMFTQENPVYCHAMIEVVNKKLRSLCLVGNKNFDSNIVICGKDLGDAHKTCINMRNNKDKKFYPYAAWWYCIYSIKIFINYGYPAPYFFCGDDIEFGLRIKKSTLFLNGICVWHPSFEYKKSALREYLSLRNYALRCSIYMKRWKYELLKIFCRKIARCLASNDYEKCAIIILALNDFIYFTNIPYEGDQLIARVNNQCLYWHNINKYIQKYKIHINTMPFKNNFLAYFYVFITFGGAIIPSFLQKKNTVASFIQIKGRWNSKWTAYKENSMFRKFQRSFAFYLTIKAINKMFQLLIK